MSNGLYKGNPTYFGRKNGSLEDIVSKINEANPKPEVFDIKEQGAEYKKVFDAAMKKFGINSPADLKSDEEKKKFFDYVDSKYKAKGEQMDDKAQSVNQSQVAKDGEEKSKVKKTVNETVRDMLLKAWKQAAQMAESKHESYDQKVIKAAKMYMKDNSCTYEMAAEKYGCSVEQVKKYVETYNKEAVDNPYAVGMAQAMKKTGDKPPLKKSTITKAHDIAKGIEKSEK